MATPIFKQPKRTKSAGAKRALIHYERQYRHQRNKSVMYQAARFKKYGSELCYINTAMSIIEACKHFEKEYGDFISPRHAVLIINIKHLVVAERVDIFSQKDILETDLYLREQLGYFMESKKHMTKLMRDLVTMKFLNRIGNARYVPTTRLRLFCSVMDSCAKKFFGVED